jgi:hypothetical protein
VMATVPLDCSLSYTGPMEKILAGLHRHCI